MHTLLALVAMFADDGTHLRLRYAEFDPVRGEPSISEPLRAPTGSSLRIVQFAGAPTDDGRSALASCGASILRYLPDNAYLVRSADPHALAAVPGVRWVGMYHSVYRLAPTILAEGLASGWQGPPARYSIECLERGGHGAITARVSELGGVVHFAVAGGFRIEATLTPSQVLELSHLDAVSFIDPAGPAGADMNIIRQITGANLLETLEGIRGQGVRGEVFDTGVLTTHLSLQHAPPILHGGSAGSSLDHGTTVYGILFSSGETAPASRGLLPQGQGIFADYMNVFGGASTLLQHMQELVDSNGPYRAVFRTSSVGHAPTNAYTSFSAETDDATFRTDLLNTQAMGPSGSTLNRPEAWAKNVIAVGDLNHFDTLTRADDTWSGLSTGPAADGRVKPDLVHFGDQLTVICAGSPTCVINSPSGASSWSTPIVAGTAGLVCQMWHEGLWAGHGGGASVFDSRPHMATIKALLVHGAYRYNWLAGGANGNITRFRQGWGTPDLGELYMRTPFTTVIDEDVLLTQGSTASFPVNIPGCHGDLRVTLVYTDPPASPAAAFARVNNLNLKVTAPDGGALYWGNAGLTGSNVSAPGLQPDDRNTVENVFIAAPQAGTWTVEVLAPLIAVDSHMETTAVDADFALVISLSPAVTACYPDCTGECVLNLADFGCFQTKFALGDPYADCNGDGLRNLADFGCFQTKFALGCP